jgi:TonB-linked SusC/RagA family outer membrane protein
LKLRGTYGLVGNDAIGRDEDRFFYLSNVEMNSVDRYAQFGIPGSYYGRTGVFVKRNANEDITWEIAYKTNIGFELSLLDNKFTLEADYFKEHRTNILMERTHIPTTMGLTFAERANVGEAQSRGVDGSINYAVNFGKDWWLKARANFTYAASEFLKYEEPIYPDSESYRSHLGYSLSQQWGFIAERLFIDDAEVANSPVQFGEYAAGDIKYRDVNGDGKITDADMVPIGFPADPEIIYGFGFSTGYKYFDLSCFFQGSACSSFWINAAATSPFNNEAQLLKVYAESHWSEEKRDVYALWPRLSENINENNVPGWYNDGNLQWAKKNTWFMRDGRFLRLKSLEAGYTLPNSLLKKLHLANARLYVNGTNLLCFSKFKLWDIEMGGEGLGYPIQKSYNIGLTVSF